MITETGPTTQVTYNLRNHYWALPDGLIWSSASRSYVQTGDIGLSTFLAAGNKVSEVESADALQTHLMLAGAPDAGPKFIPVEVEAKKLTETLQSMGLLQSVYDFLMQSGYERTEYALRNVRRIRRDGSVSSAIGQALGWSDEQLNQLFRQSM